MSECVVQAIRAIAPGFVAGDLGGGFRVPSLEPFHIKQWVFLKFKATRIIIFPENFKSRLTLGKDGGLKIYLTDVNVYGASNFKIEKLR